MRQLKTKPSKWNVAIKSLGAILPAGALALGLVFSFNAGAVMPSSSTVVVTPTNTQGWNEADTRTGGDVNFVTDTSSPFPSGALQLTTDATTAAKAQYMHAENTPLSDVTELSYSTKQVAGPAIAAAAYQLVVDLNGGTLQDGGFTTFVYEPYQNGTVVPSTWQTWDVAGGQLWSSRSFSSGTCTVTAGGGGAPFYTLSGLQASCPDATVIGFGVNIGANNPAYNVETDGVNFDGITYNFEVSQTAAEAKEACKNGGYQVLVDANGNSYKNQGQCVADMVNSSNSKMHRE